MDIRNMFRHDDVDYSPAGIHKLSRELGKLRAQAFHAEDYDLGVQVSSVMTLLRYLADVVAAHEVASAPPSIANPPACTCWPQRRDLTAHNPWCAVIALG